MESTSSSLVGDPGLLARENEGQEFHWLAGTEFFVLPRDFFHGFHLRFRALPPNHMK